MTCQCPRKGIALRFWPGQWLKKRQPQGEAVWCCHRNGPFQNEWRLRKCHTSNWLFPGWTPMTVTTSKTKTSQKKSTAFNSESSYVIAAPECNVQRVVCHQCQLPSVGWYHVNWNTCVKPMHGIMCILKIHFDDNIPLSLTRTSERHPSQCQHLCRADNVIIGPTAQTCRAIMSLSARQLLFSGQYRFWAALLGGGNRLVNDTCKCNKLF